MEKWRGERAFVGRWQPRDEGKGADNGIDQLPLMGVAAGSK